MAAPEILQHLLEIEGQAAELEQAAAQEAARRVQLARSKLDTRRSEVLGNLQHELDADWQNRLEALQQERQEKLQAWQDSLARRPQNRQAFARAAWQALTGALP